MTAEIAILNKSAVALAADSAVTIGSPNPKIFNTVNKLFTLSKFNPVGVMIYGNAQFLNIPWEIIFKAYRQKLGAKSFPKLSDYLIDFIAFMEGHEGLFSKEVRYRSMEMVVIGVIQSLKVEISKRVEAYIKKHKEVDLPKTLEIIGRTLRDSANRLEKVSLHPGFDEAFERSLSGKVSKIVHERSQGIFENLPIQDFFDRFTEVATKFLTRGQLVNKAGIVVAGYGEDDFYPRLESIEADSLIEGKLRYVKADSSEISEETNGEIIPFAQTNVVHGFLSGIDPSMEEMISKLHRNIFERLPEMLANALEGGTPDQKEKLVASLKMASGEMVKNIDSGLQNFKQQRFVHPIMETVAFLPKDELAAMAETLVSLTSFKRKFSLDAETVGGPIDVAVISKGDGFIWIKRKHYFKAELNPNFLTNYLKRE